jgi:hypothetical protein
MSASKSIAELRSRQNHKYISRHTAGTLEHHFLEAKNALLFVLFTVQDGRDGCLYSLLLSPPYRLPFHSIRHLSSRLDLFTVSLAMIVIHP